MEGELWVNGYKIYDDTDEFGNEIVVAEAMSEDTEIQIHTELVEFHTSSSTASSAVVEWCMAIK